MGKKDKRVDQYIAGAAEFAKPVLSHLRQLVHEACPQVEEVIKWSFPNFDYKGPLCSMAAFKEHCSFGFWKASLLKDAEKLNAQQASAMGNLGKIKSLSDLPPDKVLSGYLKEAIRLNDEGIKLTRQKKDTTTTALVVPGYFLKALSSNKAACKKFESFSPSHKKEYVQWITEAKTEETRNKRMAKALEQIEEGKGLNWKYEKPKAL